MELPNESYPRAIVPEHLTKLTIERLPLDVPYYAYPGEEDDFEPPAIFVAPDRKLKMSKAYAIDATSAHPKNPLGRVGVLKTFLLEPSQIREAYIADLRFVAPHQLVDFEEITSEISNQEEYMEMVSELNNTVEFDAFIAAEPGVNIKNDIPEGTFYGDTSLYQAAEKLHKHGNTIMEEYMRQEAERKIASENKAKKKSQKKISS